MISRVLYELSLEESLIRDSMSELIKSHNILEPNKIFIENISKSCPFVNLIDHKQFSLK